MTKESPSHQRRHLQSRIAEDAVRFAVVDPLERFDPNADPADAAGGIILGGFGQRPGFGGDGVDGQSARDGI